MALTSCRVEYSTWPYCGGTCVEQLFAYLNSIDFGRDTTNCEQARLTINGDVEMRYQNLDWANYSGTCYGGFRAWVNGTNNQAQQEKTTPKNGRGCYNYDYWWYGFNPVVTSNVNSTLIRMYGGWSYDSTVTNPNNPNNGWFPGYCEYTLPNDKRITAPQGVTASFPTSITGTTTVSATGWGLATNMTGTPTTYPNAKYWNIAVDLLDKNGNYLAHICKNTGETLSASFSGDFYTGSGLQGSAVATGSVYTLGKNAGYKMRAVVNNSFNQSVTVNGANIIYSAPPEPTINIDSCLYVPSTKDCTLTFSYSKAADVGDYTETMYYSVYDDNGKYYRDSVSLGTITDGSSKTGTITVTGLPSGEKYCIKVWVTSTAGTSETTKCDYAPVANAAFLGYEWDDVRRTCVIRAEAPGAANCRIQAGYAANVYNIADSLTPGEFGSITVKDLNHGSGQIMYLQAVPEASDGHQFTNEIAKISLAIPNPILGIIVPPCEEVEKGAEQLYIVDIVEKKNTGSCTVRWQNGDRVTTIEPCTDDPGFGKVFYRESDGADIESVVIQSLAEFNSLCEVAAYTNRVKTINGKDLNTYGVFPQIVGIEVGPKVNDIPDGFMSGFGGYIEMPIVIPDSVRTIGSYFLYNNGGYTFPVTLSDNLTYVGDYFMSNCNAFNQPLTFPDSLTEIGDYFMYYATNMNSVITANGLKKVGDSFMRFMPMYNAPTYFPELTTAGDYMFSEHQSRNNTIDLPKLTTVGDYFLNANYQFNKDMTLPALKTIGDRFMSDNYNYAQRVALPSLLSIGDYAFSRLNNSDWTFDLPLLETIGDYFIDNGFLNNSKDINLPSAKKIGNYFLANAVNQPTAPFTLELPVVEEIGDYFLYKTAYFGYSGIEFQIPMVKKIGAHFMDSVQGYNAPFTIPATVTSIDPTYFMYGMLNALTITVEAPASVLNPSTDDYAFSVAGSTSKPYVDGHKLEGTYADEWADALPNRDSAPFRNLVTDKPEPGNDWKNYKYDASYDPCSAGDAHNGEYIGELVQYDDEEIILIDDMERFAQFINRVPGANEFIFGVPYSGRRVVVIDFEFSKDFGDKPLTITRKSDNAVFKYEINTSGWTTEDYRNFGHETGVEAAVDWVGLISTWLYVDGKNCDAQTGWKAYKYQPGADPCEFSHPAYVHVFGEGRGSEIIIYIADNTKFLQFVNRVPGYAEFIEDNGLFERNYFALNLSPNAKCEVKAYGYHLALGRVDFEYDFDGETFTESELEKLCNEIGVNYDDYLLEMPDNFYGFDADTMICL